VGIYKKHWNLPIRHWELNQHNILGIKLIKQTKVVRFAEQKWGFTKKHWNLPIRHWELNQHNWQFFSTIKHL
jgi:hypothetical protein